MIWRLKLLLLLLFADGDEGWYCPGCGAKVAASSTTCGNCGYSR